ncbi:MAG: lipoyl synthase [Desulfobacterales bacterium]|nr:lipoyl synthase [Desulfobacterales bacterium]
MATRKNKTDSRPAKPPWIRVAAPGGENYQSVRRLKAACGLHTVCESALCPNIAECWHSGHATFMIMGSGCTRNCRFCGVGRRPQPLDTDEPRRVARAVAAMGLNHAVVTSVTRDDLSDGGASHFAATIKEIRKNCPDTGIEVLIPDFEASHRALETVLAAGPDIVGHNVETVARLYPAVRPMADYRQSLSLLCTVKQINPACITKSGFMLGLGETMDEIRQTIKDIQSAGAQVLTLGQYLKPGPENMDVVKYFPPEVFAQLKQFAMETGFALAESGPLVRSSYRAAAQAEALGIIRAPKSGKTKARPAAFGQKRP